MESITASLHVIEGPDEGRLFKLNGSLVTIGRNAENTIVLNDATVSGVNSRFVRNAHGGFTIHDSSSTNGTEINGQEQRAADLKDGDEIKVGATTLVFHLQRVSGIVPGERSDEGALRFEGARPSFDFDRSLFEVDLTLDREELQSSYARLKLLEQLDRVLAELEGATEILNAVLDASLAAANARRGFVLLADSRSGEIVPSVFRDLTESVDEKADVPFSKALAFDVVASGRGFVAEDRDAARPHPILLAPITATGHTTGVIHLDFAADGPFSRSELATVEAIGRRAGACIAAARSKVDFDLLFSSMIDAIMKSIQAKDVYTRGHSERVRHYSKLLAKEIGLSQEDLWRVSLGAGLHDIGKIGMPDSVLKFNKQPRLTDEQMQEVRQHPVRGGKILGDIPFLKDIVPAAELHHEDWNGGGYPHGLKGEEIPLIARIVAVADTYDAITTDRPYQKGKSYTAGHEILRRLAGKRLEPDLVEPFVEAFNRYRKSPDKTTRLVAAPTAAAPESKPAEPGAGPDGELDPGLQSVILIG